MVFLSRIKIALEFLQQFLYYTYTFYTSLLKRNTFKEYWASYLETLEDLAQYRIVIAAMIPTLTRTSSSLTAAAMANGLRLSPIRPTISLILRAQPAVKSILHVWIPHSKPGYRRS